MLAAGNRPTKNLSLDVANFGEELSPKFVSSILHSVARIGA